jgi:hypothetical protein
MGSTFKSNDTAISDILKDIDQSVNQLPDFQCGWVWGNTGKGRERWETVGYARVVSTTRAFIQIHASGI